MAKQKYGRNTKRLAGDAWPEPWQTLITTILSAQNRDEVTIPVAERLFSTHPTLESLSRASYLQILKIIKSVNYNKTKARHVIAAAKYLLDRYAGRVPDTIEELIQIPGVGRKTANLVITECHKLPGITVDTHVHRISNVLGLVKTKTPHQTEEALKRIAQKNKWSRINRLFVLWGKEVQGRDKKRLLKKLEE